MRVVFLTSTPASPTEGSGTFVALDGMLRGLETLGHDVSVRPLGFRSGFHTLDRWLYNARTVPWRPDVDVVVGVDLDGFLWARWGRGQQRYVVSLKGVIADELRNERGLVRALLTVQARWERRNVERADRVVVTSRYSADVAEQAYAIQRDKIVSIPEPIDLADWRRRFSNAVRHPKSHPTVLAVARMYPRKRLQDLLDAAIPLRRRIPDVRIRIVGQGPEFARLQEQHSRLGLGETVTLLGEVSKGVLAVEYASADCFCLPSVQEGFGLVFAEAMAAGLPIVACRAAAIPDVVEDGRTGLLVSPRQPEALADALARLLLAHDLRNDMGMAGMRRVMEFDLVPVARRWVEALSA